jgi:hypothetical protein
MRRIILACALAGILSVPAQAQSLRDQLVGAWSLVSCNPDNQIVRTRCGTNPHGIVIYDASGRYTWIIAARDRPKASAGANSPVEELKAIVVGMVAQFGTWSVNETDKTLTAHIDGALFQNNEGTKGQPTPISVSGDEYRIAGNVYQRIKR